MNPGAFAISADGNAVAYTYCVEFGGCRGDEIAGALSNCQQQTDVPCYICDIGGRVVWRNADGKQS
jgi:hypothetical protein